MGARLDRCLLTSLYLCCLFELCVLNACVIMLMLELSSWFFMACWNDLMNDDYYAPLWI